mgnify:CR=1 FL=1
MVLDGRDIHSLPGREVARRLGLLPQSALAPDGITVAELVARGRYPHQSFLRQWSPADERAVAAALRATRVDGLAERPLDALSGGQRQRVWIAMVLAQETPLLLLDEPVAGMTDAETEFTAELFKSLARKHSLMVVEHDMGFVGSIADHVTVLHQGHVLAEGSLAEVQADEQVIEVYLGR